MCVTPFSTLGHYMFIPCTSWLMPSQISVIPPLHSTKWTSSLSKAPIMNWKRPHCGLRVASHILLWFGYHLVILFCINLFIFFILNVYLEISMETLIQTFIKVSFYEITPYKPYQKFIVGIPLHWSSLRLVFCTVFFANYFRDFREKSSFPLAYIRPNLQFNFCG